MDTTASDIPAHVNPHTITGSALRRWSVAILALGLVLFLPAGTVEYWQAWLLGGGLGLASLSFIAYYLAVDPQLLAARMRFHEKEREQRAIQAVGLAVFLAAFAVPGFDRRFGWSDVPVGAVIAADAVALIGYGVFVLVMRENRYASRVIEIQEGQRVISTGPYAIVRHPMYSAVLMIYVVAPIALGSWWGLLASVWTIPMITARIRNEEATLRRDLPGYAEYLSRTRYRLVPGVW